MRRICRGARTIGLGRTTLVWVILFVLAALLLIIGIWFLQRYYAKASLDTALVRTGFGGSRVVIDGGCLSLPILHRIQKVSMGTLSFTTRREGRDALMTKDKMRADVIFEFELRVNPTEDGIATAAQALGQRIARNSDTLSEVLSGSLVDAVQIAAASRTLEEIHLDRAGYSKDVSTEVSEHAQKLGLILVSTSLLTVDQSDLSQWSENNAFNAEGMRKLAELVAEQRKERVRIETSSEISVRESHLVQHQRQLELKREESEADIAQNEHLVKFEAEAKSREDQARETAFLASQTAKIENEQRAKEAQVQSDEALRKSEMDAILALEEAKISNGIKLSKKRTEEADAKAAEEEARAKVLLAAESVQAQKERAVANREHEIAQLIQDKELGLEAKKVKSDVETLLAKAQADTAVAAKQAESDKVRMEAEAVGRTALILAENTLSDAVIRMKLEEQKLDRMPEIMTQMMKPVEKIDSIKINQISGLGGDKSGDGGGADSAFGAAMDQILGMAVRLPAMKQMGEEIGLDFDANLAGRTADYVNRTKAKE